MDDTISRKAVIYVFNTNIDELVVSGKENADAVERYLNRVIDEIKQLPAAHEPLTDKEQRIFLAAMGRERKVCKEVDDQYTHEPYEVLLTKVCSEIERKVKKALWS